MNDIYSYTDYRTFLEDFCAETRKSKPFYSYRYLGTKCGLRSPSFLSWVIKGKRNISAPLALRLASAMKLRKREADYFVLLVSHNQATLIEEQQHYLEKLLSFRSVRARIVSHDAEQYYTRWYYAALRELVAVMRVRDESDVALSLCPSITKTEAREALNLLVRLKMIRQNKSGIFERTETTLSSGPSISPAVIHSYQITAMRLGQESLRRFSKIDRDISTVTFSCSRSSFERIQERVSQMRAEIAEIACSCKEAEQVFQMNVQLFPLSDVKSKGTL